MKLVISTVALAICGVIVVAFFGSQPEVDVPSVDKPGTTVAVSDPELLSPLLVTAYLKGLEGVEKTIGPGQAEATAANELELLSDLELLRVQIAELKQLGQQILDGSAGPAEHQRFRERYAENKAHELRVLAAIQEYQSRAKSQFATNASTMGYAGVDFSLSMRDFNQRYANKKGTAEHDPATQACTFTLKNLGPARHSAFEFVDEELCKISFAYHSSFWDEFGGPQGIGLRIKERLGPATKSHKVDGLTIVEWQFPERNISLAVGDDTAAVQIVHLPREAKRLARQAAADKARERKVLSRDAGF